MGTVFTKQPASARAEPVDHNPVRHTSRFATVGNNSPLLSRTHARRRTSQAKPAPPELASGTGPPLLPGEGKECQKADDLLSSDVGGTAERGSADKDNDNSSLRSEGQEEAERVGGGTDASSPQSAVAENVPKTDAQERVEQAVSESGSAGEATPPSDAAGDAGDGPTALAEAGETGDVDGSEDPALPASPSGRQDPGEDGSAASDIVEGLGSPSGSGKEAIAEVSGMSTPSAEEGGDAVGERGSGQASRDGGYSNDDDDDGAPVSHVSDEYGDETESEEEDNVFAAEPSCEDATASVGTGVEDEEAGMTRDEASEGGSCKGDEKGEGVPAETTARSTGGDDDVSAPEAGFVDENGGGDTAPVGSVDPSHGPGEGEPESPVENPPPSEAPDEPLHREADEPAGGSGDGNCADPDCATGQGAAEPVAGPSEAAGEDERSPGVPEAESEGDAEGGVCGVGDEEAAAVGLTANGGKPGGAVDAAEDRGGSSALLTGEALPREEEADVEGGKGGPQEEEEEGTEDDVVFLQVRWRPCSFVVRR